MQTDDKKTLLGDVNSVKTLSQLTTAAQFFGKTSDDRSQQYDDLIFNLLTSASALICVATNRDYVSDKEHKAIADVIANQLAVRQLLKLHAYRKNDNDTDIDLDHMLITIPADLSHTCKQIAKIKVGRIGRGTCG